MQTQGEGAGCGGAQLLLMETEKYVFFYTGGAGVSGLKVYHVSAQPCLIHI